MKNRILLIKANLLASTALAASVASSSAHAFVSNGVSEPDDFNIASTSLEEELKLLRSTLAEQISRLDAAEKELGQQRVLIKDQSETIKSLRGEIKDVESVLTAIPVHRVVRGDTVSQIALRYGVSVQEIVELNKLKSADLILVGQELQLPLSAVKPAPRQMTLAHVGQSAPTASPPVKKTAPAQTVNTAGSSQAPAQNNPPEEVGVRPEDEDKAPPVAALVDVGGILTPKGSLLADLGVDFTSSADNRFFFQGVEIANSVLLGAIEATDIDRTAITESIGLKYGITDRLEIDGRVPYVQRHDRVSGIDVVDAASDIDNDPNASPAGTQSDLSGHGLGDAEVGMHYQINNGRKLPFVIANLRAKTPTGKGPFDVARDDNGLETELATGSGFWSVEPSVTFILPSAPAVVFANVGYQFNLSTSPDAQIGETVIKEFDPGDALRFSMGVGLSLNERLSVNAGWDQSYLMKTRTLIEGFDDNDELELRNTVQPSANVGSFLLGGSYAVNDRLRLNLNSSFGATDDAPDMRVSLRLQYKLFD